MYEYTAASLTSKPFERQVSCPICQRERERQYGNYTHEASTSDFAVAKTDCLVRVLLFMFNSFVEN